MKQNSSRYVHAMGVLVTFALQSLVVCGDEVQIGINATFDHSNQAIPYRTLLSIGGPWRFEESSEGKMFARFLAQREGCFATASWETTGQPAGRVGPAIVCLANASVNAEEFNQWLGRGNKHGIDPALAIPLQPLPPLQPNEPTPNAPQTWVNSVPIAARIFLRGCDDEEFRRYGDLHFAPGMLRFTLQVDFKGALQVELSAQQVVLELDPASWESIRDQCDKQHLLPAVPANGFSQDFHGTSQSPPPDPKRLSGKFSFLFDQLQALSFRGESDRPTASQLESILVKSVSALQKADVGNGADRLGKFRAEVEKAAQKGRLEFNAAQLLMAVALDAENFIRDFQLRTDPFADPGLYCPPTPGQPCVKSLCSPTVYHVDDDSSLPDPDGSEDRPFPTINAALSEAQKGGACGVALFVAPGFYPEDISITRDTQIFGSSIAAGRLPQVFIQGSFNNSGPRLLEIQDVFLIWNREERAVGVFVDNPCALTRMRNVVIRDFRGFGIRQRGGSLSLANVRVSSTKATEALVEGTGILLSCGTRANMSDVILDFNETSGLFISGAGTEVQALGLTVGGTRVHPIFADPGTEEPWPWGGVFVNDGAHLEVYGFRFARNTGFGVRVQNRATASLELGTLANTGYVGDLFHESPFRFVEWANNVGAFTSGHVRLQDVICTRAGLCGLMLSHAGEIDYQGRMLGDERSTSEVSENPIGVCLGVAGYPRTRLTAGVVYRDNGRDIEGTAFATAEPSDPSDLSP